MSLSAATPRAPNLSGCALDDRYELHAVIGEGAFGRVYRGRDRRLARSVAVKVVKPWWAEDRDWVRSFEREAQLMASVSCPGIVQIFDVGHAEEGLYYVAELVEGESIASRLRRGPLATWQARDVAEQLSRSLASAHAQRIVHRDIKPANILISDDGQVKVTDFGVAGLLGGSSGQLAATLVGTPAYMAPEQARCRDATPASDVYSIGVVLYEMLAGEPPFNGGSPVELALAHLQDSPPSLPSSTPGALTAIVGRSLAKHPDERYRDGSELADALARTRRSSRTSSVPAGAPRDYVAETKSSAEGSAKTLIAPWTSPRRNVHPAARRRTVAAFSFVVLLLVGMVGAASMVGGARHARVPDLHGLTRATIRSKLARTHFHVLFRSRYSGAQLRTAIAQSPSPGASVTKGSRVVVTLSAGPRPVAVPRIVGLSSSDARRTLQQLGLRASIKEVPAPGTPARTVTAQTPSAGMKQLPGSTISVSVAEAPRWRTLFAFSNRGGRSSPPFRIRGTRWRIRYRMAYDGPCTFIFFCSSPRAEIANLNRGTTLSMFDLNEGGQIRTFDSGPAVYQVRMTQGEDTTHWSAEVEDYY